MSAIVLKNAAAAVLLGLAVAAAASPALAKERGVRNHPGHAARAQAIGPVGEDGMSQHRADALRKCNEQANRLGQITFGVAQSFSYSSCMVQQGETP